MKNEDGQALFELIIFLPLLIFIFTIIVTIGDSINGSINQQKAVRRYFFHLYKGNSTLPSASDLGEYLNLKHVGVASIAWSEEQQGDDAYFAGCFPFSSGFLKSSDLESETCDNPLDESKSRFIRVYTAFGLCGESYSKPDGPGSFVVNHISKALPVSCTLQR